MAQWTQKAYRHQFAFSAFLIGLVLLLISLLYMNLNGEFQKLRSATSDNTQWTLSQVEVEFLEFEILVSTALEAPEPEYDAVRRAFDIFYSRINIISSSSTYEPIKENEDFLNNLIAVESFLQRAVTTIDANDTNMGLGLHSLARQTIILRSNVRKLSNAGLAFFARESDERRNQISTKLTQMAVLVTGLLIALLLLAVYLSRVSRQNIRRRTEVIQASERMKIVTSTSLDAVIACDTNGIILDFNAAAEQIFGYSALQAIGSNLADIMIPEKYLEQHEAGMQRMRHNGEKRIVGTGRIKLEAKRANGDLFPIELAVQSAQTKNGEVFVSFLRDISPSVAAEKALVEARDRAVAGEKAKTDFLATMSHEIRTPLNGLLGNLSLLNDTLLSEKQQSYIKNMDTSGKLLMSHISDVLDITKYDAGKLQLRPVPMNISTLLQDIIDNQGGAATANQTSLNWHWGGAGIDWILADEDRIQHILMNVIGNAVKFTRDGDVNVTAEVIDKHKEEPTLVITVQDTGIGMSAGLKAQIFDDFMTGDASYDRDVGGTGLGLGIAQRFVKALGGTITVDSEEGVGSQFYIRLPITPTRAPEVNKGAPRKVRQVRSSHVLLVEDNQINSIVASEMLKASGHTVTLAENGAIALELAQEQSFDIILMDISMPVMDGRAATRAIRALEGPAADTPIVALTANAMADEQKAFLTDGMNDILTKPLSRDSLLDVLSRYLEASDDGTEETQTEQTMHKNQHLKELQDTLGADALQPLLERFHSEIENALTFLTNYQDHPLEEVARQAHKVAGSAATLGASELRGALIKIEEGAKTADQATIEHALSEIPQIWDATRPLMTLQ